MARSAKVRTRRLAAIDNPPIDDPRAAADGRARGPAASLEGRGARSGDAHLAPSRMCRLRTTPLSTNGSPLASFSVATAGARGALTATTLSRRNRQSRLGRRERDQKERARGACAHTALILHAVAKDAGPRRHTAPRQEPHSQGKRLQTTAGWGTIRPRRSRRDTPYE